MKSEIGSSIRMPLPRRLGRINRRITNPILWPIVSRLPGSGFGRIVHVGRRSGRVYRTPMLAFRSGDRIVFALTYGPDADWVRNVLTAGECEFETRHRRDHLVEPRLVDELEPGSVPSAVAAILERLGAPVFLAMRCASRSRTGHRGPRTGGRVGGQ